MRPEVEDFWRRADAELVEQEARLEEMKIHLHDLEQVEAEDMLAGWYRDVAGISDES